MSFATKKIISKSRPGDVDSSTVGTGQSRRYRLLFCLLLGSFCVASCGMFRKEEKQPEYYDAIETPPLKIPEGLNRPASSSALVITTPLAPLPQKEMKTVPPRVSSQSSGENDGGSIIKWSEGGAYLLVQDSSDSVHRRLGFVIERAGVTVSELEDKSGYRFEYWHNSKDPDEGFFSKMAFWRDDAPNYSGIYRAVSEADGANTRVFIKNADGSDADPDAAEHLLAKLGERLG
jgi:uncharacterized lipoprotein